MDKEVNRRKPAEGPHRKVAGTTVVVQGEESVIGVKTFQVFPVSAFRLAAMSGCVRTDITSTEKDRKETDGGRNWKQRRDDAVICA